MINGENRLMLIVNKYLEIRLMDIYSILRMEQEGVYIKQLI